MIQHHLFSRLPPKQRHLSVKFLNYSNFFLQVTMKIQLKCVLLLVTFALADKQIKLEDIERDNLLSERRVNRDHEIVNIGQSQRLNAPIHVGPQYEVNPHALH